MQAQLVIMTNDTIWPLFCQLVLKDKNLAEGVKDMGLTWILPDPKASKNTVLKVKCFMEASFNGSKGVLVSCCRINERF